MGEIVGAFATSHVLGAPDGVEDQAERVFQGMREIGARLRAAGPDVVVVITSDHLNNFDLARPLPFAIAVDPQLHPYGDMGLPRDPIPGAPEFAAGFAAFASARGTAVSPLPGVRPDHGVMIPLGVVDPERRLPAALLYVNSVLDAPPEPADCWMLGELLGRYIRDQRPARERAALLAGGGLSHWLAVPEEGRVAEAWDRAFLDTLTSGRAAELAKLTNAEIERHAGNGGLEVAAWITLAAAVRATGGRTIYYEAMPEWASGMAGVELAPG